MVWKKLIFKANNSSRLSCSTVCFIFDSFLLSIRNMAQLERWNCRETLVSSLARRVFLTDFPNFVSDTKRRVVTAFPLLGSLLYLFNIALIP